MAENAKGEGATQTRCGKCRTSSLKEHTLVFSKQELFDTLHRKKNTNPKCPVCLDLIHCRDTHTALPKNLSVTCRLAEWKSLCYTHAVKAFKERVHFGLGSAGGDACEQLVLPALFLSVTGQPNSYLESAMVEAGVIDYLLCALGGKTPAVHPITTAPGLVATLAQIQQRVFEQETKNGEKQRRVVLSDQAIGLMAGRSKEVLDTIEAQRQKHGREHGDTDEFWVTHGPGLASLTFAWRQLVQCNIWPKKHAVLLQLAQAGFTIARCRVEPSKITQFSCLHHSTVSLLLLMVLNPSIGPIPVYHWLLANGGMRLFDSCLPPVHYHNSKLGMCVLNLFLELGSINHASVPDPCTALSAALSTNLYAFAADEIKRDIDERKNGQGQKVLAYNDGEEGGCAEGECGGHPTALYCLLTMETYESVGFLGQMAGGSEFLRIMLSDWPLVYRGDGELLTFLFQVIYGRLDLAMATPGTMHTSLLKLADILPAPTVCARLSEIAVWMRKHPASSKIKDPWANAILMLIDVAHSLATQVTGYTSKLLQGGYLRHVAAIGGAIGDGFYSPAEGTGPLLDTLFAAVDLVAEIAILSSSASNHVEDGDVAPLADDHAYALGDNNVDWLAVKLESHIEANPNPTFSKAWLANRKQLAEAYAVAHPKKPLKICGECGGGKRPGVRLQLCSACLGVWYCGRDCQKAHWPTHKTHCLRTTSMNSGN